VNRLILIIAVALVATAHAAPPDAIEVGRKFAKANDVALYSYHEKYIRNADGFTASIIATRDGGTLLVGTRSSIPKGGKYEIGKSRPVVIKLDRAGSVVWEQAFTKKGFLDHEGGSAIEVDDGFVIYIQSYVHPARGSVARLLKLDPKGALVWERQLRGDGGPHTPFPQSVQLTRRGTFVMTGHIYLDKSERAYGWDGEVAADGKLLSDVVGKADPYKATKAADPLSK
jgi:hypothetical protein